MLIFLIYPFRWKGSLTCTDVSTHCLRTYRSQLQSMTEATFNWRPYDDILGRLPDICRSGMAIWQSCCPLLCYAVVEHHYPQRVMRQFGMFQYIPNPIAIDHNEHARLHAMNRSGKTGWNWLSRHAPYVSQWEARHQNLVTGELTTSVGVANDYMSWYMQHTVLYVSNPQLSAGPTSGFQDEGARVQMMVERQPNRNSGQPQPNRNTLHPQPNVNSVHPQPNRNFQAPQTSSNHIGLQPNPNSVLPSTDYLHAPPRPSPLNQHPRPPPYVQHQSPWIVQNPNPASSRVLEPYPPICRFGCIYHSLCYHQYDSDRDSNALSDDAVVSDDPWEQCHNIDSDSDTSF
ncbi:putative protein-serine/threonine phosphatase [Helianthus debilis subsp. tardiflorus]